MCDIFKSIGPTEWILIAIAAYSVIRQSWTFGKYFKRSDWRMNLLRGGLILFTIALCTGIVWYVSF